MTHPRTDGACAEIAAPFDTARLFQAAGVHREYHPPKPVQLCTQPGESCGRVNVLGLPG